MVVVPAALPLRGTAGGVEQKLNDRPLRVSTVDELIRSLLTTGFPYNAALRPVALANWNAFSSSCE